MPLTSLELTVDQKRPGWLARAGVEAAARLESTQRPALCAELRRDFGRQPALSTLSRYLRLHLLPGEAPPQVAPTATFGACGAPADASGHSAGLVPHRPALQAVDGLPETEVILWMLGAGEALLVGSYLDHEDKRRPNTSNVRCLTLEQDNLWRPNWDACGPGLWRDPASDGSYLAAISVDAPDRISIRTLEVASGRTLWSRPMPPTTTSAQTLVVDGTVVVLDADNDTLTGYHAASGEPAWHLALTGNTEFYVYAQVLACGPRLVLCGPHRVMAVEGATGTVLWEAEHARWGGHLLWSGGGQLGLHWGGGELIRYDLASGERLPEAPRLRGATLGVERILPGRLATAAETAVINAGGTLCACRLTGDNEELWRVPLQGALQKARLAIVEETVLLLSDGHVCGFSLQDGRPTGLESALGSRPLAAWGHPCGILMAGDHWAAFIGESRCP